MSASLTGEGVGESSFSLKRKRLTSVVWTYFNVVEKENRRAGSCKICAQVIIGDSAAGTTNLKRHLSGKHGIKVEDESEFPGCPYTQDIYREKIALSIVKHDYPFSMVEHEGTRDLHSYLNRSVKYVCRNTAKSDVLKLYQKGVHNLRKELDCIPGRICLTSDMWHSTTSDGYMSLTAHYIDSEWKLQSKLLAFHHVPPPHNGPVLAERLYDLLKQWKVERKVLTLTLDNAKYNDTAVNSLKAYFDMDGTSIQGNEFLHVRCGAHVLNLIVKSGLGVIENAIHNIRESVKYVKGSEIRRKKFATYAKQLSIVSKKKLQQDVSTRWNSTYNMLERALIFKEAFKQLDIFDSDYKYCSTWDEWSKLEKMAKFLQPFNEMTILFSGRTYPTANLYFENVWKIQMRIQQSKYSPDDLIREMAVNMEPMFLKYWECYSMVLSFAVVLDPRYKFVLVEFAFKKLDPFTKDENVSRVRQKLFALFEEYSKLGYASSSQPSQTPVENFDIDTDDLTESMDSFMMRKFAGSLRSSRLVDAFSGL